MDMIQYNFKFDFHTTELIISITHIHHTANSAYRINTVAQRFTPRQSPTSSRISNSRFPYSIHNTMNVPSLPRRTFQTAQHAYRRDRASVHCCDTKLWRFGVPRTKCHRLTFVWSEVGSKGTFTVSRSASETAQPEGPSN